MSVKTNFGNVLSQQTNIPGVNKFIWSMPDFLSYSCNVGQYYESPQLIFGANKENKWALNIYLNGFNEGTKSFLGIGAYQEEGYFDNNFVVKFAIINKQGAEHFTNLVAVTDCEGLLPEYLMKSILFSNNLELLSNNELRILCHIIDISIIINENDVEIDKMVHSKKNEMNGFETMLNNEMFSDFKLIIKGKEFHVHRAILAAKSPIFEAMFKCNMRETNEGKAHIEDIEPIVIEKMLHFVYTGQVHLGDLVDKVLVAAEKYQLDSLKLQCEYELVKKLKIENVYDILLLADQNNAAILKKKAVEFFNENSKKLAAAENFKAAVDSLPGNIKTEIICVIVQER